jgi:hypothetical protein
VRDASFQQDWCRIEAFLPVGRPSELLAAEDVIAFLKQKYKGFTYSALRPASFEGFWWQAKRSRWMPDKISVLIVDIPISIQTSTLDHQIQTLQRVIADEYAKNKCPQEAVWVSCHQILMKKHKLEKKMPAVTP